MSTAVLDHTEHAQRVHGCSRPHQTLTGLSQCRFVACFDLQCSVSVLPVCQPVISVQFSSTRSKHPVATQFVIKFDVMSRGFVTLTQFVTPSPAAMSFLVSRPPGPPPFVIFVFSSSPPPPAARCGIANAEIKFSSAENAELSKVLPLKP